MRASYQSFFGGFSLWKRFLKKFRNIVRHSFHASSSPWLYFGRFFTKNEGFEETFRFRRSFPLQIGQFRFAKRRRCKKYCTFCRHIFSRKRFSVEIGAVIYPSAFFKRLFFGNHRSQHSRKRLRATKAEGVSFSYIPFSGSAF